MREHVVEQEFLTRVLSWWQGRVCEFPWRKSTDPYKVLVTELMLVRTKARQVAAIWGGFFGRYPDARTLAAATDEEVQVALGSLGLRWRARKIRSLAIELCDKYGGEEPGHGWDEAEALGPYSRRAARMVIRGFGELPVDWGVARVLARVNGIDARGEIRRSRRVIEVARELSPCSRESFWGLVDLARDVCLPNRPRCQECPLVSDCRWAASQRGEKGEVGSVRK